MKTTVNRKQQPGNNVALLEILIALAMSVFAWATPARAEVLVPPEGTETMFDYYSRPFGGGYPGGFPYLLVESGPPIMEPFFCCKARLRFEAKRAFVPRQIVFALLYWTPRSMELVNYTNLFFCIDLVCPDGREEVIQRIEISNPTRVTAPNLKITEGGAFEVEKWELSYTNKVIYPAGEYSMRIWMKNSRRFKMETAIVVGAIPDQLQWGNEAGEVWLRDIDDTGPEKFEVAFFAEMVTPPTVDIMVNSKMVTVSWDRGKLQSSQDLTNWEDVPDVTGTSWTFERGDGPEDLKRFFRAVE